MKRHVIALLVLLFAVASGLSNPAAEASPPAVAGHGGRGDAVLAWNEIANDAMVTSGIAPLFDPFHESRIYAMVHIAIHDALNAIKRRSRPYAVDLGRVPSASPQAAVATAAHDVLVPALRQLPAPPRRASPPPSPRSTAPTPPRWPSCPTASASAKGCRSAAPPPPRSTRCAPVTGPTHRSSTTRRSPTPRPGTSGGWPEPTSKS